MIRDDALNSHSYPVRSKITAPSLHVFLLKGTNQKSSSSKKLYRIAVPWMRTNQKASLSPIVPRTKTNINVLLANKKTQIMRLHMMCRAILMPLTFSNAEESFWTDLIFHMNERTLTLQENYSLWRCWIILSTIMNVTAHHFPVKIFKKQLAESWQDRKRKKKIPNVKSITLLWILCFSVQK